LDLTIDIKTHKPWIVAKGDKLIIEMPHDPGVRE